MILMAFKANAFEVVIMDYEDLDYENPQVYEIKTKPYKKLDIKWYGPEGIELDKNGDEIGQEEFTETQRLRQEILLLNYRIRQLENYNCYGF